MHANGRLLFSRRLTEPSSGEPEDTISSLDYDIRALSNDSHEKEIALIRLKSACESEFPLLSPQDEGRQAQAAWDVAEAMEPSRENLARENGGMRTGSVLVERIEARIYSPTLGRFMQTDPIGYEDNTNLYAYVGNDPINGVDPTGEECKMVDEKTVTCTMKFDKKVSEMSSKEKSQAVSAIKAYTVAAAKAQNAAEKGMEFEVEGKGKSPSFTVPASQIRDELFDNSVVGRFKADKPYLASNTEQWGIQVYKKGLELGQVALAKTFLHEGIHTTPAERAAIDTLVVTGRSHKEGYDRAARYLYQATPRIRNRNSRLRRQKKENSWTGIFSF